MKEQGFELGLSLGDIFKSANFEEGLKLNSPSWKMFHKLGYVYRIKVKGKKIIKPKGQEFLFRVINSIEESIPLSSISVILKSYSQEVFSAKNEDMEDVLELVEGGYLKPAGAFFQDGYTLTCLGSILAERTLAPCIDILVMDRKLKRIENNKAKEKQRLKNCCGKFNH